MTVAMLRLSFKRVMIVKRVACRSWSKPSRAKPIVSADQGDLVQPSPNPYASRTMTTGTRAGRCCFQTGLTPHPVANDPRICYTFWRHTGMWRNWQTRMP